MLACPDFPGRQSSQRGVSMKSWLFGLVLGALPLLGVSQASAAPVLTDGTVYRFGFDATVGSPLYDCSNCIPTVPVSTNPGAAPWTFTLTTPGTLTVLDLFLSTDQFEIFNSGVSLGLTSTPTSGSSVGGNIAAALADTNFSRGVFNLIAGDYSITGTVAASQLAGAGVFWIDAVPIPVPAGLLLMLTGAVALGGLAARRMPGSPRG